MCFYLKVFGPVLPGGVGGGWGEWQGEDSHKKRTGVVVIGGKKVNLITRRLVSLKSSTVVLCSIRTANFS